MEFQICAMPAKYVVQFDGELCRRWNACPFLIRLSTFPLWSFGRIILGVEVGCECGLGIITGIIVRIKVTGAVVIVIEPGIVTVI